MSRTFTKDEVALHNTKDDLWIIVHGKVYNVTEFQSRHPGGKQILRKVAGKDATKKFKEHHSSRILDWDDHKKLLIGILEKSEQTETPTEHKGSFFGKLAAWGKKLVDSGADGQVKVTETVVVTSKRQEELTTSQASGVTVVAMSRQQTDATISKVQEVTFASTSNQWTETTASKSEGMEKGSVEEE